MASIPFSGSRIRLRHGVFLETAELRFTAMRASGPGGQHVNTTASAVQLRFDIAHARLPERVKQHLLTSGDQRIDRDGVILIRAENERSQLRNREAAVARLAALIEAAAQPRKRRIPTQPTSASRQQRKEQKIRQGQVKARRRRVREFEH